MSSRRRNNFSSSSGIRPFTGRGRVLGSRRGRSTILSRVADLVGAAGTIAGPLAGAVGGRAYLKRKISQVTPSRRPMTVQRSEADGSGGSISSFNYGAYSLKIPRSVIKNIMPIYKQENKAGRLASAVGLQNATVLFDSFTGGELKTYTGVAGVRLLIEGVRAKVFLTNVSNSSCCVSLYDIVASTNAFDALINSPVAAWQEGVDVEGGAVNDYKVPGVTPFGSDAFKRNYHILKRTDVILGQGVCHQHSISYFPNRAIHQSEFQYNDNLKDLTIYCMAVYHGLPANDTTTKTQVSLGQVDLDYVSQGEVQYKTMANAVTTYSVTNSLPAAFTVGQSILNIGSGAVATETEA